MQPTHSTANQERHAATSTVTDTRAAVSSYHLPNYRQQVLLPTAGQSQAGAEAQGHVYIGQSTVPPNAEPRVVVQSVQQTAVTPEETQPQVIHHPVTQHLVTAPVAAPEVTQTQLVAPPVQQAPVPPPLLDTQPPQAAAQLQQPPPPQPPFFQANQHEEIVVHRPEIPTYVEVRGWPALPRSIDWIDENAQNRVYWTRYALARSSCTSLMISHSVRGDKFISPYSLFANEYEEGVIHLSFSLIHFIDVILKLIRFYESLPLRT